jgi:WW domain-containing oxidoreductase
MKTRRSGFDRRSTAEQVTDGIDLSGKTALITGVNSGLGFESMRVLSERGAHVIGAARTIEKARKACAQVKGQTTPVACELSDFDAVIACAETVQALDLPLDILMCNAGIMALPELEQCYGYEMQFVTNHLGHFLLIRHLLEQVKAASAGRVVLLSSAAHMMTPKGGIAFDNLTGENGYRGWSFYGQSKLANLLTALELTARLEGSSATANAVHPGVISTNLGRYMDDGGVRAKVTNSMVNLFGKNIAQGAATQCYVATNPDLEGISGRYFADCNIARSTRFGRDRKLAARLWQESEEILEYYLPA